MEFRVYEEADGTQPVAEQLARLKDERPDEFDAIFATKETAENLTYEKAREAEYIKNVRGKIDALKIWGKQSRILGFRDGPDFIAAHHVIKKQDAFRDEDIRTAAERRERYYDRND